MDGKVLVVDDDRTLCWILGDLLAGSGFSIETANTVAEAQAKLQDRSFDVAIVDLTLPDGSGADLVSWLTEHVPFLQVIILSATSSVDEAVRSVRPNVFEFVRKPVADSADFARKVARAVEYKRAVEGRERLFAELTRRLEQLHLAHRTLQSHALAVQADLAKARLIQQRLLPRAVPWPERISLAVVYRTAGKVGGDLYDVFPLGGDSVGLYVADVCGHGLASAMLTVFLREALHAAEKALPGGLLPRPDRILAELNRRLGEDFGDCNVFISMTCLVLDTARLELAFSNAGHPPLLVRRADGGLETHRTHAPALGIDPKARFTCEHVHLRPSDAVVLYTDGIREAHAPGGGLYDEERLHAALLASERHADAIAGSLERDLLGFCAGQPLADDVTLVVLSAEPQRVAFASARPPLAVPEELPPPQVVPEVLEASRGQRRFVVVSGAGTWAQAQRFREVCEAALEAGQKSVVVDLGACAHLDSTFLGTLHDLVGRFESRGSTRLELQNPPRSLRDEMSELGLAAVLRHVRHRSLALPSSMRRPAGETPTEDELSRLVLHAHEALLEADPRNADRFSALLRLLHEKEDRGS